MLFVSFAFLILECLLVARLDSIRAMLTEEVVVFVIGFDPDKPPLRVACVARAMKRVRAKLNGKCTAIILLGK